MRRSRRRRVSYLSFLAAALVAGACLFDSRPLPAQQVGLYVTSKAGDRLAARAGVVPGLIVPGSRSTFRIDEATRHQTIAGFGASFLEAGLVCINDLPPDAQEGVLRALFDPKTGAGFSAMKSTIAGTDFMSAGPWYTYDDTPGDTTLAHFSIARDLGPNGLVTYIKRARKYGRFVLQAPMDYPPDWMLVDVNSNQDVRKDCYDVLARYYLRYLEEYRKQGIDIDYLCLFNEPGCYTKIPYNEIRVLLRDHVGPLLAKSGLATKLMLSEAQSRPVAADEYPKVLDDPVARKYVAILPYHGYDFREFDRIKQLHDRYPDLPLWQTEVCHAGVTPGVRLPRMDYEDGDFWANQVVSDLEAHASAWIYWNMVLDQNGGPWLVSPIHGNPDPNVQHPLVVINRNSKQVSYTAAYYYLAHFSKFVRPGAVRVATVGTESGVRCVAFRTPEGGLVAQFLNSRKEPAKVSVEARGRALALTLPALSISTALWQAEPAATDAKEARPNAFVRVSPRDPHYLELSDGRPYIPIGLNLIAPNTADDRGLARMDEWLGKLAANGGNYARIWLGAPFWDVEHRRSGEYDETRARRIDELFRIARRHGIRLKLTLEHFREMSDNPRQSWANKPLHLVASGGTARNMDDFFSGDASRARFRKKLAWYAERYGDDPIVYGWELWNEVNAVRAREASYVPWTEAMLVELHRLFPKNLAMQSLGSFDSVRARDLYRRHSLLQGNDVAQVHRYLDPGAPWEVCHGPVDVLASEAVAEILSYDPKKPVILAESGAVEWQHSGPSKQYARDKEGIILHDILFAPFFSGAAGSGQIWHWDVYVDRNNLWHHFARFAAAVRGLDPVAEAFEPVRPQHDRLGVYALKGKTTTLAWCRDSQNTWQTELESGRPPERLEGLTVDIGELPAGKSIASVRAYDPWTDRWSAVKTDGTKVVLPAFRQSVVIRAEAR
jgi:O-glycosyl hydrolase